MFFHWLQEKILLLTKVQITINITFIELNKSTYKLTDFYFKFSYIKLGFRLKLNVVS
jgi:hypothetical protein